MEEEDEESGRVAETERIREAVEETSGAKEDRVEVANGVKKG